MVAIVPSLFFCPSNGMYLVGLAIAKLSFIKNENIKECILKRDESTFYSQFRRSHFLYYDKS